MSKLLTTTTFAVSDVKPAVGPLPEVPYHRAVTEFLEGPVEACSNYYGSLVDHVVSHPLIAALHGAFTTHRPLSLSPDAIWLTITQGLATHINENAESQRRRFVSHDDKLKITVRRDEFVKGSPDNPWPGVFTEFSSAIREHIGPAHDLIVADFSTTGPVERAASEVVLLDAMQAFFEYEVLTVCGIPAITLEGTVDDWRSIESRVEWFREFDLGWWVAALRLILKQFTKAAAGQVDRAFWESIYRFEGPGGSGSPFFTGWAARLFPYLRYRDRDVNALRHIRNPWLGAPDGVRTGPVRENIPRGPSKAPFRWLIGSPRYQEAYDMEFIGGLIGVSQDPGTLCLRPEIGWAIRDVDQWNASRESWPRPWESINRRQLL